MTMLQIKGSISGNLLSAIQYVAKIIIEIERQNGNNLQRYMLLLNSNNAWKKYIIVYDHKEETAFKFFWKLQPEMNYSKYIKNIEYSEDEEESIFYKNNVVKAIHWNSSSINELKDILDEATIDSFVYDIAKNDVKIYVIHRNVGWQQLYSQYLYRDFKEIPSLSGNYDVDNQKLYSEYNVLKEYLKATDKEFTLPIFAYMLFAVNKSLFNLNNKKKFAMNIRCASNNTDVIRFISRLNMNFTRIPMDQQNIFPTDIKKEFVIPTKFCSPTYLKNSEFKLKDFPVFLYKSASDNDENNLVNENKIGNNVLQKDLNSQISYIFLNLINNENDFITIASPDKIQVEFLNYSLSRFHDLEKRCSFQKLVKDYMKYISNILSKEINEQNNAYKSEIIEKIYYEFSENNENKLNDSCIRNFVYKYFFYEDNENLSEYYFKLFEKMIRSFNYKKFESIIDVSISNNLSNKKIISECIEKIKINITNSDFKKISDKKIKTYIEIMADIAVDRYREVLINEYIYTQNYKPQYFNNLYTNAEKELKEILLGKKYDRVQVSRCSFLLAAMVSFKNYVDECLPEKSESFDKYFQEFQDIAIKMCNTPPDRNIDNATLLSEFSAFLKSEINSNAIIDIELRTDSDTGWIDRKMKKIYLDNARNKDFYGKFTKYLMGHDKRTKLSKRAFNRDVLEANGIIIPRTASKNTNVERYDYEHKIGDKKHRVLVLDCELLNIQ